VLATLKNFSCDISKIQQLLDTISDRDPELGVAIYTILVKILLMQTPQKYIEAFDRLIDLIKALEPE
jgi:hypothetical protein